MPPSTLRVFTQRCAIFVLSFLFWQGMPTPLLAQYNMPQNKVWAFSLFEGLNFSPGPGPVSIVTNNYSEEGSASVSDNSGNLLFYTSGTLGGTGAEIYNRTGAIMPNGYSVVPYNTFSCTQAAAIVPVFGNPNRYYVFSLEQGGGASWYYSTIGSRLYYCIVDMTLNGGLGDVIPSTIATPLDSGLSEKMTVVRGDNCNIWLLAHKKDAPEFKAYNISASGISPPVVSTATGEIPTGPDAYKIGTIKVSPDRTMIANCVMNGYPGVLDRLELLQFSPATGIVSGCQVLNNFTLQYDAEFSPDNSKLYTHIMGSKVYQYDLSLLPSLAAVISSEFLVYTSPDWGGQMKLGPNGKIYLQTSVGFLDCINLPNLPGSSCNYTYHAVHLAGSASVYNIGMPNMQIVADPLALMPTVTTTSFCAGLSATLTAPPAYTAHVWNTGVITSSVSVTTTGTYWVTDTNVSACMLRIDTFHVTATPPALMSTVSTTSFCAGLSATLTAPPGYTAHVWNTGAITSAISVTATGNYWVADTNLSTCMLLIDTFHVTATSPALTPTVTTTSFCEGLSATLTAPPTYTAHVWNIGAITSTISVTAAGNYWVADTNLVTCMLHIDTFHVTATPFTLIPIVTTTSFCEGSSATLAAPPAYTAHIWNTGATTPSVNVAVAGTYRVADTSLSTCILRTDTFHVTAASPTLLATVTTTVFCAGSSATLTAPPGYTAHVWNTGATTPSVNVTEAGTYLVADTNLSTCMLYTDTFHVTATPPALVPTVTTSVFCAVSSATLTAPTGYTAHVWSTGATTSSVSVTGGGAYWVADTVFSTCTLFIDTFHVTATPPALMPTVTTASFCIGLSAILTAPPGYTAHAWNTGATTSSIYVTDSGNYWVADTVFSTCTLYTDTFQVTAFPLPVVALGNDTTICLGDSVVLSSPMSVGSFLWSTGSTASSITVQTGDIYHLTVTNRGCSISDTINISQLSAPSQFVLGRDTVLCNGDELILNTDPSSALWSTGAIATSIAITVSGTYSATVTNVCGTSVSSINIGFEPCDLDFPNAFTPNNDGRNDVARAIGHLNIFMDYTLNIYNRFGQRVFYTQDIYAGWDGTLNSVPQDLDTYFYMITYTLKGKHGLLKGDLTLIR